MSDKSQADCVETTTLPSSGRCGAARIRSSILSLKDRKTLMIWTSCGMSVRPFLEPPFNDSRY